MSSKRPRIVRSLSQGEIGLFSQVQPIESREALWEKKRPTNGPKPSRNPVIAKKSSSPPLAKQEQQPRKSVLTLGSPTIWEPNDEWSKNKPINEGFGEFLKACSLCKKKLLEDVDLYMYGYLNAFCSAECRDDRIALDGFEKQASLESTKLITGRKDRRRQGFGS